MDQRSSEPAAYAAASSDGVEISLLDIVLLLARRRRFILGVTAVATLLALVVAMILPKKYTATTTLLPPQQNTSFASSLLSQLGGLGSLAGGAGVSGLKSPNDAFVGLMKAERVEDGMILRFHLQEEWHQKLLSNTRKMLESKIKIDGSGKDGLIRISAVDESPEKAASLANGYVEEYRNLSKSLAIGEASQRRLFLEQQLTQAKEGLAKAEEDLKRTEQATGIMQVDSQARALMESAAALRAQITAKEVQVQSMRTYAGSGNTDLIQSEQELSSLRGQLSKLIGSGSSDDLVPSKGRIPESGLEYLRKVREVKYNEALFEILARQYEVARLDEAKEGSMVQVVDAARVPDYKSGPSRALICVGGLVTGFGLGCVIVLGGAAKRYVYSQPKYAAKLRSL